MIEMLTQQQREKYFEDNKALVYYVLHNMLNISKQDTYYEDMVQQGYLRLLHCIDKYDWGNSKYAFSTFAVTALLRHLRLYINKERTGVYTISGLDIADYLYIKIQDEEHMKTNLSKTREMYVRKVFDMKTCIDDVYEENEKPKYCLSDDTDKIEHINMIESLNVLVNECLQDATGNTKRVIEVYWENMKNDKPITAVAISKVVGISKQRVNSILLKFRKKMRLKCEKNGIRG